MNESFEPTVWRQSRRKPGRSVESKLSQELHSEKACSEKPFRALSQHSESTSGQNFGDLLN